MHAHAAAALLDLDNILHTGSSSDPDCDQYWATATEADEIVSWVLEQAEEASASHVLGAGTIATLHHYLGRSEFPHRINLRTVPDGEKDAADLLLLREGVHLVERGYTRFVIASGDGAFADLAALPQVDSTVLAYDRVSLSRRLEVATADVRIFAATRVPVAVAA